MGFLIKKILLIIDVYKRQVDSKPEDDVEGPEDGC